MISEKTSVRVFLKEQVKDREVAKSFYQGLDELRLAVNIAQKKECAII